MVLGATGRLSSALQTLDCFPPLHGGVGTVLGEVNIDVDGLYASISHREVDLVVVVTAETIPLFSLESPRGRHAAGAHPRVRIEVAVAVPDDVNPSGVFAEEQRVAGTVGDFADLESGAISQRSMPVVPAVSGGNHS